MKNAIALAAVAGLATAASAQSWSLSISGAPASINTTVTTVFTVDIIANADFGTNVSGGSFELDSTGADAAVVNVTASAAAWAAVGENDRGYLGNGDHAGLVFGQVIFPPFFPPAAESELTGAGVVVGSLVIEVLAGSTGMLNLNLAADAQSPFGLEIYNAGDESFNSQAAGSYGSASVNLVPAPSAMALLGLGGLVAGRRRR